jgi:hypothetical protein
MMSLRLALGSILLLLLAGERLLAEAASEAQTILEHALTAKGSAELLDKFKGRIAKGHGVLHSDGHKVHIRYECHVANFERSRAQVLFDEEAIKVSSLVIIDHDQGWIKYDDQPPKPMAPKQLAIEKAGLYLTKITWLAPLKQPDFKLTALGAVKLHGRPAVGLQVNHARARPVKLYFDPSTWLLLKAEQDIINPADGIESPLEMYPGDYREVRGIQEPLKVVLRLGNMPYAEYAHTELRLVESLDDELFAEPAPPAANVAVP